jgi:hypothetical protein
MAIGGAFAHGVPWLDADRRTPKSHLLKIAALARQVRSLPKIPACGRQRPCAADT